MNELEMVQRLGRELRPTEPNPPNALRYSLLKSLDGCPKSRNGTLSRRRMLIGAGGLAVLLTGGAVAAVVVNQASPHNAAIDSKGTDVLHRAALAAYSESTSLPRSGQFVFSEQIASYPEQQQQPGGGFKILPGKPTLRQTWLSVDGSKPGLVRTRPQQQTSGWADQFEPAPRAGFISTIPNEPAAMMSWLYSNARQNGGKNPEPRRSPGAQADPIDQLVFQQAGELLTGGTYLTSAQRAALFDALADLPATHIIQDNADLAGRLGVAVGIADSDSLIFDPVTYAFLGTVRVTILKQAIVESAGQLP